MEWDGQPHRTLTFLRMVDFSEQRRAGDAKHDHVLYSIRIKNANHQLKG
jgi:hypothetical protein